MDRIESISGITRQFETGDRPVLVCCSDQYEYLCKYNRFGGAAEALAREFIGTRFASIWGFGDTKQVLVSIRPEMDSLVRLLSISLFDIWIANDDRTCNNLNLMYDFKNSMIIPIDHAGIFNTSLGDSLSQLDYCESLLFADFVGNFYSKFHTKIDLDYIKAKYIERVNLCQNYTEEIINEFPEEWLIPIHRVRKIFQVLFSNEWIEESWKNFCSMLKHIKP